MSDSQVVLSFFEPMEKVSRIYYVAFGPPAGQNLEAA